jgi:hypothetical protein
MRPTRARGLLSFFYNYYIIINVPVKVQLRVIHSKQIMYKN